MYNLNYNVTNARLNRPVGRPFVPYPRTDPFSSSLVIAIPGSIFKNGYVNVFNQVNEFDDISAYIVSGAVLNESTNAYFELGTTQSINLTGSYGSYSASYDMSNFPDFEYRTSLFFTGSVACIIAPNGEPGVGINITSSKSFVIESWVAFPITASYATASGDPNIEPILMVDAQPNRVLAQKYIETNTTESAYLYQLGWSGNRAPKTIPRDWDPVSGSSVFYVDRVDGQEISFFPQSSSAWTPYQWKHYAISMTAGTGSGAVPGTYRQYIDGILVGQQTTTISFGTASNTPTQLFGDSNPFIDPFNADSASKVAGAYYQDFRMYNGTNKNYTGSQFTPPESMIIGVVQPYPQYNP